MNDDTSNTSTLDMMGEPIDGATVCALVDHASIMMPGHQLWPCYNCDRDVVVNPATMKAARKGEMGDSFICAGCAGWTIPDFAKPDENSQSDG